MADEHQTEGRFNKQGGYDTTYVGPANPDYVDPAASKINKGLADVASKVSQKKAGPPDANSTPQPKIESGEGLGAFSERLRKWRETQRGAAQRKALSGETNP